MENNEFRGLNEGVILYVLKSGDRHTDEIKSIIDGTFFEIKVGTLYSIITRLKNQKYINEYRSSSDGSRRKYFALTSDGVTYFNNTYGEKFSKAPKLEVRTERVTQEQTIIKREKKQPTKKVDVYENFVKNVQNEEVASQINEIDFSKITNFDDLNVYESISVETPTEIKTVNEVEVNVDVKQEKPEPKKINPDIPSYTPPLEVPKPEIDYDSVNNVNLEYKSVLNSLFPKNTATNQNFSVYQPYEEAVLQEKPIETDVKNNVIKEDFDDIYTFAEKDGIKIKTSSDTNRYEGSKILHNLLRFHTSLVWYGLVVIEYLLLSLFMSKYVPFYSGNLGKIFILTAIIPILTLIIYVTNTRYAVKDLPRFKDVIEISLIIAISAIIIVIALSSILEIDFKNMVEVYNNLITPILLLINIPMFYVIKYFLSNLDYYQVI